MTSFAEVARIEEVPDWEQLRDAGEAIKADVMARLDELLLQFEAAVEASGGNVHWARRGAIVAFVFHNAILNWLNGPLPAGHKRLLTIGVAEPFTVTLTVCVYAALVFALPVTLWQLWSFFAPAVEPNAERRVLWLVLAACGLGAAGISFAYWIVLPRAIHWLTNWDTHHFLIEIQAQSAAFIERWMMPPARIELAHAV